MNRCGGQVTAKASCDCDCALRACVRSCVTHVQASSRVQ